MTNYDNMEQLLMAMAVQLEAQMAGLGLNVRDPSVINRYLVGAGITDTLVHIISEELDDE